MAKIFKFSAYVIDRNGEFETNEDFESCLDYYTSLHNMPLYHIKTDSVDVDGSDGDLPNNRFRYDVTKLEKHFKES